MVALTALRATGTAATEQGQGNECVGRVSLSLARGGGENFRSGVKLNRISCVNTLEETHGLFQERRTDDHVGFDLSSDTVVIMHSIRISI